MLKLISFLYHDMIEKKKKEEEENAGEAPPKKMVANF